jgi:hypothetical protein
MSHALQDMLIQPGENQKILLLPAWTKDWNARFKLHAPLQTTVEGEVIDGKLQNIKVTPNERESDLIIPPALRG